MNEGILLVDKPQGWTSFDVVNKIRYIVAEDQGKKPKQIKVGHTGTLDPFATGLLVVLIGKSYTKMAEQLTSLNKTYIFEAKMGDQSTTGDPEGEITSYPLAPIDEKVLRKTLEACIGENNQIPPAYSAIKIDGKRAYELARKGDSVVIPARVVSVFSLELIYYDFPMFTARTEVSKGTYIRTLVEDICKDMGTYGYTTQLRRIATGEFDISNAIRIDKGITIDKIQKNLVQTL